MIKNKFTFLLIGIILILLILVIVLYFRNKKLEKFDTTPSMPSMTSMPSMPSMPSMTSMPYNPSMPSSPFTLPSSQALLNLNNNDKKILSDAKLILQKLPTIDQNMTLAEISLLI